jgi:hypothetical protein
MGGVWEEEEQTYGHAMKIELTLLPLSLREPV